MDQQVNSMSLNELLVEIRGCRACEAQLPCGPRPIVAASRQARVLIIGQAPGKRVHETGVAWNDPSGERLRDWMGVQSPDFYDESKIAIVPMGFCYPGKGKSGDLPPRKECAELWHERLLEKLENVELTLLIGQYAQKQYLGDRLKANLTETVRGWDEYWPEFLPLPHPSPRNNIWLSRNRWFEQDVLPRLKSRIKGLLG